jgi:hypothetical protein
MTQLNNKQQIDALFKKYQNVLVKLNDALEKLAQKPKEVIKEVPITEFVEVPKIVEVEVIKDLTAEQKSHYESQINDLKAEINTLKSQTPNIDYWGRPKTSKKIVNDLTYEQKIEQKYQRLVQEVKLGKLNINSLTPAEAEIVNKLLNEE